MRIAAQRIVQIGDVTPDRQLRLDAMVNILQETAVLHSRQVGVELNSLLDSGKTWVMSRMALQIMRLPKLDEEVAVQTWSRRIERFKGLRDYSVLVGNEPVAAASTLWLFLDMARRRPVRVPENYALLYGADGTVATTMDIEHWQPPETIAADYRLTITTRISDFDVNGHVNNAVVLQYIQTAVSRVIGEGRRISTLQLAFLREIPCEAGEVQAAVEKDGSRFLFQIRNDATVFVSGVIETAGDTGKASSLNG